MSAGSLIAVIEYSRGRQAHVTNIFVGFHEYMLFWQTWDSYINHNDHREYYRSIANKVDLKYNPGGQTRPWDQDKSCVTDN